MGKLLYFPIYESPTVIYVTRNPYVGQVGMFKGVMYSLCYLCGEKADIFYEGKPLFLLERVVPELGGQLCPTCYKIYNKAN